MKTLICSMLLLACLVPATAGEKLNLLIIDGQNNHNWVAMTPIIKAALLKTERFNVDVVTSPKNKAPDADWATFRPDFAKYNVVLSNYNGKLWPKEVQASLEKYVSEGGGLVNIHAANNAFPEWGEWNKMIGLGWRGANFGDRLTVDADGKVVRTPKNEGPGAGHGAVHAFQILVRDPEHPVMKGMPQAWMHGADELYHGQRGPAENMTILASAFSAKEKGGTGAHEPMVWVIPYGKGRVFTTVMGHVGGTESIRCVGFQSVMARGAEWAATGSVTLPLPANFPTATSLSLEEK